MSTSFQPGDEANTPFQSMMHPDTRLADEQASAFTHGKIQQAFLDAFDDLVDRLNEDPSSPGRPQDHSGRMQWDAQRARVAIFACLAHLDDDKQAARSAYEHLNPDRKIQFDALDAVSLDAALRLIGLAREALARTGHTSPAR